MEHLTGLLGPHNEPNCGVTACAIVTGQPFDKVFAFIKRHGNRNSAWKGRTYFTDRIAALKAFNTAHTVVYMQRYRHERRVALATWAMRFKPGVTYLVDVTGHTIVMRDGCAVDQHLRTFTPLHQTRLTRRLVRSVVEIGEVPA